MKSLKNLIWRALGRYVDASGDSGGRTINEESPTRTQTSRTKMPLNERQLKCPGCGYVMRKPDWRCPECYCEFENYNFDSGIFEGKSIVASIKGSSSKDVKKTAKETQVEGNAIEMNSKEGKIDLLEPPGLEIDPKIMEETRQLSAENREKYSKEGKIDSPKPRYFSAKGSSRKDVKAVKDSKIKGRVTKGNFLKDEEDFLKPRYGIAGFEMLFPPHFSVADLKNPTSLAVKLKESKDPLSQYLKDHFSVSTRKLLIEYDGQSSMPESLQGSIIKELNRLIQGNSIYNKRRFRGVELKNVTEKLVRQNPQGMDLIRLNRCLLCDAYPDEIVDSQAIDPDDVAKLFAKSKLYDEMKSLRNPSNSNDSLASGQTLR